MAVWTADTDHFTVDSEFHLASGFHVHPPVSNGISWVEIVPTNPDDWVEIVPTNPDDWIEGGIP